MSWRANILAAGGFDAIRSALKPFDGLTGSAGFGLGAVGSNIRGL
jgi:hypothetical protein